MSAVPRAENDSVTIAERIGVSAREYRIRGDYDGVCKAFKAICDEWHPLGYGTRLHSLDYGFDGVWEARASRLNTCE